MIFPVWRKKIDQNKSKMNMFEFHVTYWTCKMNFSALVEKTGRPSETYIIMVQWVNAKLATPTCYRVLMSFLLFVYVPAKGPIRFQDTAPLSPTSETLMEFQAPGFSLAQPRLLQSFIWGVNKQTEKWKISLSLCHSVR